MDYLDFELPLKELKDQLEKCNEIGDESKVDVRDTSRKLKEKIEAKKKEIYSNITPWQRVQLSRHPSRPYTLDYLNFITENNFLELHGDRNISDDKAMIGGLGKIDNQTFMFIGQQKGNNIKTRQYRNFGMANPEGYRKALRLMKLAEDFSLPIITFIDTPGAYPGIESEERGMSEAIAKNLSIMSGLKVPIIVIITSEGGSGGALTIGVGDHISMLQYSIYSVASPEACASIVWRDNSKAQEAAEAMKLDAKNLLDFGLIDNIIDEPLGGAHRDTKKTSSLIAQEIDDNLKRLREIEIDELIEKRYQKIMSYGSIQKWMDFSDYLKPYLNKKPKLIMLL